MPVSNLKIKAEQAAKVNFLMKKFKNKICYCFPSNCITNSCIKKTLLLPLYK